MNLLYAAHVLTALVFLGPITLSTSSFHTRAYAAHQGDAKALGAAQMMYRVTKVYGWLSLLVPAIGVAAWIFAYPDLMKNGVYHTSILLSVVAWALLLVVILPRQRQMLAALGGLDEEESDKPVAPIANWEKAKGQLSMFGGIFNALWFIVALLMIIF
ncbi:DUF2269 domain-containing protein [Corynebacterium sp. 13CS0277]|uniref:DUF2269 domain-containing protein n=1 Tax=Corynebacterium sp. 13CS0277 TaxID=2071994 RepID=UPI000D02C88C|nr:DUF2269 domain-containing protein [Corynebacterium sp. 13CS0277]PRQ12308.1 DUF2269 domain-containing protein [Corynebacterium sp. 13CS0277]